MRLLRVLLAYSRSGLVVALAASVLSGVANAGLLAVINRRLGREISTVEFLVWTFVLLMVLAPALRVLSSYLLVHLSQRAVHDLRMQLSRRVLAAPLRRLEEVGTHRLTVAITQDVGSLATALADLPLVAMHAAIVVGSFVYLGWLSWRLLLVLLVFLVVGIASYRLPLGAALRRQRAARDEADTMFRYYRGVLEGTKELKLHARRRVEFLSRLDASGRALQRLNVGAATIYSAAASWGQMLAFAVVGLILFAATALLPGIGQEVLIGYTLVLLYITTPLQIILNTLPDLGAAAAALRKVEALGLSLDKESEPAAAAPAPAGWSRIDLVGVRHHYQGEDGEESFSLGPIDLTLRPGELVFVAGGNGSGKTTLAKLLVGLYWPHEGELRLDGWPVGTEGGEAYRQLFSVVFVDFYLFDTLFGLDGPTPDGKTLDGRARRYLETLQIAGKVDVQGGRLSTIDLSHGQRKRLALLTAYLEDRPIYVFDEWAADQDPAFREVFYRELLPELRARGKTVVVISHDDRYYSLADRLLKLEYGRLVYDGRPALEDAERPLAASLGVGGGGRT
jgi:putative ATP-binding cassette transporter